MSIYHDLAAMIDAIVARAFADAPDDELFVSPRWVDDLAGRVRESVEGDPDYRELREWWSDPQSPNVYAIAAIQDDIVFHEYLDDYLAELAARRDRPRWSMDDYVNERVRPPPLPPGVGPVAPPPPPSRDPR